MNGKYKFCALWSCGCVLSERALKEVESENCHNCGCTFEREDIVVIYPEDEDLTLMEENMKSRKEKIKALRKERKSKKVKRKLDSSEACNSLTSGDSNGISTASNKVNGDHKFEAPKMIPKKLAKKSSADSSSSTIDPKQSKVYKGLFTSGAEKKSGDTTPHWITYNPYHL